VSDAPPDPSPVPDPLDALVEKCVERFEREGEDAIAAFCGEHPGEAPAILARLELLRGAGLLGQAEPAIPERLGEFRLLRRLGAGGMGVVYLAEQRGLGRRVALKLVRPNQLYFPETRRRFRREVEAAARLQHEGIVTVHTVGEEAGIPYYAMEYVPGCTLAAVLARLAAAGRPPGGLSGADLAAGVAAASGEPVAADGLPGDWVEACLHVAVQVADALGHAHQRGVVHRDVKPSNILLTTRLAARLADFGLAKLQDAAGLSRSGQRIGTPFYMSRGRGGGGRGTVDARADVYAAGVVLYEMLTLRVPFPGESDEEVYRAILARPLVPPRRLNPAIDRDLEAVLLKALEHDPGERYADGAALASDLRRRQRGEATLARPVPSLVRRVRSTRRWSAPALLLAGAGVAAAWAGLDAWLAARGRAADGSGAWLAARLAALLPAAAACGWLLSRLLARRVRRRAALLGGAALAAALAVPPAARVLDQHAGLRHDRDRRAVEQLFHIATRAAAAEVEDFLRRWEGRVTAGDLVLAGRVLLEDSRPARAAEVARRAAALAPDAPAVHALLLAVCEALDDPSGAQRERDWLDAPPGRDPSGFAWEEWVDVGTILREAGHPLPAIDAFVRAGALPGVDRDRVSRLRARSLLDLCRWDEARPYVQTVLLWQPRLQANVLLGLELALSQQDWVLAADCLARLGDAPAVTRLEWAFRLHEARGEDEAAWGAAESVLAQHGDDPLVVERLARLAFERRRADLADALYARLLELSGRQAQARTLYAVSALAGLSAVRQLQGDLPAAERLAREALALDPEVFEGHHNLAQARLRQALGEAGGDAAALPAGAWREYAGHLRDALRGNAQQPLALNNLAYALGQLQHHEPGAGHLAEALACAARAAALAAPPEGGACAAPPATRALLSTVHDTLAGLHEAAGDLDAAVAAARAARDALQPGDDKLPAREASLQRLAALRDEVTARRR